METETKKVKIQIGDLSVPVGMIEWYCIINPKTVRVTFKNGRGFTYEADEKEIAKVEAKLDKKVISEATIVDIDTLTGVCGYFTSQTDINSGYGCNHPDQESYEDCHKDSEGYTHYSDELPQVEQGKCYSFSCPLAHSCDVKDLRKYDKEFAKEYKGADDDEIVDSYVVCYKDTLGDEKYNKL